MEKVSSKQQKNIKRSIQEHLKTEGQGHPGWQARYRQNKTVFCRQYALGLPLSPHQKRNKINVLQNHLCNKAFRTRSSPSTLVVAARHDGQQQQKKGRKREASHPTLLQAETSFLEETIDVAHFGYTSHSAASWPFWSRPAPLPGSQKRLWISHFVPVEERSGF